MTVNNKRRATSTLSPVPDMLQSPASNTMTPKSKMATGKLGQDREKTRAGIKKRLENDKQAIKVARKAPTSDPNWKKMDTKRQEKVQEKAALAKIQQRKDAGIHVSNYYPIFKDYVPHCAYGSNKRGDIERDTLIVRHLDSLEDASGRMQSEEGDDEEEDVKDPSIKKQENDDVHELKDCAPYTKGKKAAPTKRGKVGKAGVRDDDDSDTGDSSTADSDDEDQDISEAESEISELESEEGEGENDDEEEEDDRVRFVAVSRGRPLPSDLPLPAKAYVNRKQHFATGIKCIEQAVVRGQVPRDDGKGQKLDDSVENEDSTSKKRACDDGENGGRALRKTKRVKVEANA